MKIEHIKCALRNHRNIIALVASFVALGWLCGNDGALGLHMPDALQYAGAVAVYAAFCAQNALSRKFRDACDLKATLGSIRSMTQECQSKSRNLRRRLDEAGKARLAKVMGETNEIVRTFMTGDKSQLKLMVVHKSLKLTDMYIKLIEIFDKCIDASIDTEISNIATRINTNTSNLNNARDPSVSAEIRRVIEVDERMIESLKSERKELEKLDARLQYMESTISMLKYNLISNLDKSDALKTLETEIDEAIAINFALSDLQEERRGRVRV
ncbi:MAG: hypothetical protein LBJ10_02945 [Clostridiales bacterium]|nr:hypothetical protein [Clostridiales bacterium]